MGKMSVLLGFDCDRPRGDFIWTSEGSQMAEIKMFSLEQISRILNSLEIPRTYFVCGQFLESMTDKFGQARIQQVFLSRESLSEIADHTYTHNVLKFIPTRADKQPIPPEVVSQEYQINTKVFKRILGKDIPQRGLRAPCGHYKGLLGEELLLDSLYKEGVLYLSTDCRDRNHSLNPSLTREDGTPRQPYYYSNGLLEIPTHGWQDTVFGGKTSTPVFEKYPQNYETMLQYYRHLFLQAKNIAVEHNQNFFLGLSLHPYNIGLYNPSYTLFHALHSLATELGLTFCKYNEVNQYYLSQ